MNEEERRRKEEEARRRKGFIRRVIGISALFLAVGLGVMYLYSLVPDRSMVGLETVESLPPDLPIEQVAPNRVRLLFTADGATLTTEMHEIAPAESLYERVHTVIDLLLQGPRSRRLRSPIPREAVVRGLYLTTGSAVLDLSAGFRDGLRGGASAEMLCVYSLVNTLLLNCPDLGTVTILIEGQPVDTLLGYLDLNAPLVENLTLMSHATRSE